MKLESLLAEGNELIFVGCVCFVPDLPVGIAMETVLRAADCSSGNVLARKNHW